VLLLAQEMSKAKRKKLVDIEATKQAEIKRRRMYKTLEQNVVDESKMLLLVPSGTLGQKLTAKQRLRRNLRLQKAGVTLEPEQTDELFRGQTKAAPSIQKTTVPCCPTTAHLLTDKPKTTEQSSEPESHVPLQTHRSSAEEVVQQQHHTDGHPPPRSRQYVPKLLHMLDASQKPALQAHLQEKKKKSYCGQKTT
jgi:electron transfer flavoprotein alpha subunit